MTSRSIAVIIRREWNAFWTEPLAALLAAAFLSASMALPLYFGGFFERNQADLEPFFDFLPWIFLVLMPALGMRAWADEVKSGTLESILTWPVELGDWVAGKFLSSWLAASALIALTFPIAIALSYLGSPDWSPVAGGYLAAILLAGGFLAVAQFASALAGNAIAAFVLAVGLCFLWLMAGSPLVAFLSGKTALADVLQLASAQNAYHRMADGSVSLAGVGFFLLLIAAFQAMNWLLWQYRAGRLPITRRAMFPGLFILIMMGFFAGNWALQSFLPPTAFDLTADRRHSLSAGSKEIVSGLNETIQVDFYMSERLAYDIPEFGLYGKKIQSLLEQYQSQSHGRVRVRVISPEPYSEQEDRAMQYGLRPLPLDAGASTAYFGMIAQSGLGQVGVIPQFDRGRENLLEYDLTRVFHGLLHPQKPTLAAITSLPMDADVFSPLSSGDGMPAPWLFWMQLQSSFKTTRLPNLIKQIPDNVDALLIVHPANLPEETLYAIDQYLLRRGRAVIMLDPHSEAMAARQPASADARAQSSDLDKLFNHWGIRIDKSHIVADRSLAQRVVIDGISKPKGQDYIAWLRLGAEQLNADDVLSASLRHLNFATAGSIELNAQSPLRQTILASSSSRSMLVSTEAVRYMPDPQALLSNFEDSGSPRVLAARLQGNLTSAFGKETPKFARKKDNALAPHIAQSQTPANMIVIADSDLIDDRFWARIPETLQSGNIVTSADNADFILNAIDQLLGGESLLKIRTRDTVDRPMRRLEDLRRAAEDKFLNQQKQLEEKLKSAEQRLQKFQSAATPEAEQTIAQARADILDARSALRRVQYDLSRDIGGLQDWIRLILIVLWPLWVVFVLLVLRYYLVRRNISRITG